MFVAGHGGMVGRAIVRRLEAGGEAELVLRTRAELDLTDQAAVRDFFADGRRSIRCTWPPPRSAASSPTTRIPPSSCTRTSRSRTTSCTPRTPAGVSRLLFLGSSCIYPKLAPQPIAEDSLLTGPLEATNEAYAIAKIAGIKLCAAYAKQYGHDYRAVMPTNLYGPFDNFHPENSHVIPGMLRKFDDAARAGADAVTLWGTGTPMREFLHVDDMAAACEHVMALSAEDYRACLLPGTAHVNVGTGVDCTIAELAGHRRPGHGVRRAHRVRHEPPGRHAAKAPRRLGAAPQRLAPRDRARGRDSRTTWAWFESHRDSLRAA